MKDYNRRDGVSGVVGVSLLVTAAVVVGVAIVIGGDAARVVNGVGAALWLVALGLLAWSVRHDRHAGRLAIVAIGAVVILTYVASPSSPAIAAAGFMVGGGFLGFLAGRLLTWAAIVPAAWLPIHLALAVGEAALRAIVGAGEAVRADPPPTPALVPLIMVMGALAGGVLGNMMQRWISGRRVSQLGRQIVI